MSRTHIPEPTQRFLLSQAYSKALESPDQSTQCGAVLFRLHTTDSAVQATMLPKTLAYNHFPRGVEYTTERWERPLKYEFIEHAERGAVYAAARAGIATQGLWMAAPWAACTDCARSIIESGLVGLLTHKQAFDRSPERWQESIANAFIMLDEAEVETIWYDGKIFDEDPCEDAPQLLHTGQLWIP